MYVNGIQCCIASFFHQNTKIKQHWELSILWRMIPGNAVLMLILCCCLKLAQKISGVESLFIGRSVSGTEVMSHEFPLSGMDQIVGKPWNQSQTWPWDVLSNESCSLPSWFTMCFQELASHYDWIGILTYQLITTILSNCY